MTRDKWVVGDAYEAYVGRWSRRVAEEFVRWLDVPPGRRWVDVGCGTGALTATVLAVADPAEIVGVDPSDGFLATARSRIAAPRATFRTGDAQSLPLPDNGFDAVVSGLVLNCAPAYRPTRTDPSHSPPGPGRCAGSQGDEGGFPHAQREESHLQGISRKACGGMPVSLRKIRLK